LLACEAGSDCGMSAADKQRASLVAHSRQHAPGIVIIAKCGAALLPNKAVRLLLFARTSDFSLPFFELYRFL